MTSRLVQCHRVVKVGIALFLSVVFLFMVSEHPPLSAQPIPVITQIGGSIREIVEHRGVLYVATGAMVRTYGINGRNIRILDPGEMVDGQIRDILVRQEYLYVRTGTSRIVYEIEFDGRLFRSCSVKIEKAPTETLLYQNFIVESVAGDGIYFYLPDSKCSLSNAFKIDINDTNGDIEIFDNVIIVGRGDRGADVYLLPETPGAVLSARIDGPVRKFKFINKDSLIITSDNRLKLMNISDLSNINQISEINGRFLSDDVIFVDSDGILIGTNRGDMNFFAIDNNVLANGRSIAKASGAINSFLKIDKTYFAGGDFGMLDVNPQAGENNLTWIIRTILRPFVALLEIDDALMVLDHEVGLARFEHPIDKPFPEFEWLDLQGVTNFSIEGDLLAASYAKNVQGALETGVSLFKISNSNPRQYIMISNIETSSSVSDIIIQNNRLYICNSNLCPEIFEINDDNTLISRGGYSVSEITVRGFHLDRDLLAISALDNGVILLDISDARDIKEVSHIKSDGNASDAIISGDNLYIADGLAGVVVYDSLRSGSPREASRTSVVLPSQLSIFGKQLAVLGSPSSRTLSIISTGLSDPVVERSLELPCRARSVIIYDNTIYLAAERCGVFIVDINAENSDVELFMPMITTRR